MRFTWITKENPLEAGTGAHIYSNGLLRALLRTGATGTLVTYGVHGGRKIEVGGLEQKTAKPIRRARALSLFTKYYSDAYRMKGAEISVLFRQALEVNPDVVIIDYFATGWVLGIFNQVFLNALSRPVLVYVSHNYEPKLRRDVAASIPNTLMRWIVKIDAEKAVKLDQALVKAADVISVNTDADKAMYLHDAPDKTFITLTPAYDGEIKSTRPIDETRPRRVVIMGAMDWIAKQIMLRKFLNAAEGPFKAAGIELTVVGRSPNVFVEELALKYPFCHFAGTVDDVRPYLADARIGIMPDEVGGGFKHKNLYYIFAGLPVATIRSQFIGMPVDIDHDVIAADTTDGLVAAIVASIDDFQKLDGMRQRCWDACSAAFKWDDRGRILRASIDSVLRSRVNENATWPPGA